MAINTQLSTIILDANGLNASIKKHTRTKLIIKQVLYIGSLYKTHFRQKDTHSLKVKTESKGMESIFLENGKKTNKKAILISDKMDFKQRLSNKRQRKTQKFFLWVFI